MQKNLVKYSKFNSQKILEIFPIESIQFFTAYTKGFFLVKKTNLNDRKT